MTRILVAGSHILERQESRISLEAKGYQLIVATDIKTAVGLFLEDPPDLLIVERGFAGNGELDLVRVANACLQKTNIPIILVLPREEMVAGIDWRVLPVDDLLERPVAPEELLLRIQLAEARRNRVFDNNPLSKLPGNTSILNAIQNALADSEPMAVCYVDIDNFKPYNDHYGFSQGDEVILMVARVIVNVIDQVARQRSFVGHVGGDDYVFIVPEFKMVEVCEKVLANFEAVRNLFIAPEDVKKGGFVEKDRQGRETRFGLLSISIAVIPTGHGKFQHSGQVAAVATQIKHKVKALDGNNYLIDRREGYFPD
ncbi:MAG: diguanylate cyclase [Proteobacteria bacterium]|nr:diguanylate cyclase [Desulfobulbaceae bacterium]MBU4153285.1 diguanylate cyclase [Pseudomonadota bacterium]